LCECHDEKKLPARQRFDFFLDRRDNARRSFEIVATATSPRPARMPFYLRTFATCLRPEKCSPPQGSFGQIAVTVEPTVICIGDGDDVVHDKSEDFPGEIAAISRFSFGN